jgi:hypothetical protein
MTSVLAPAAGRAVPGGALFALAIGLLLYMTTSLVLGPSGSRVLEVSLTLPSIEAAPEARATISGEPVTGSRIIPAAPIVRSMGVAPVSSAPLLPDKAIVAAASIRAAGEPAACAAKTAFVRSKRTHYHDADERSHRLARRR